VIEIHGGTLKLASEANRGTTVRVQLPAARVRVPAAVVETAVTHQSVELRQAV
jgi:hypothetical protein